MAKLRARPRVRPGQHNVDTVAIHRPKRDLQSSLPKLHRSQGFPLSQ